MIRVLVAAASVIVRAGLEALVTTSPRLALAGSAPGVAALAERIEDLQPDVLLLELELHDDGRSAGLFALGGRPGEPRGPAIVVLVDDPQRAWAGEALRSGVRAILPREATAAEIVAAVEAAAAGLVALHPDAVDSLLPVQQPAPRALPTFSNQALTPREIEVLGMLAEGLANKEIAWRLRISEHTVKFHVGSIFNKLDASSRTEAVTLGIRQGWIML